MCVASVTVCKRENPGENRDLYMAGALLTGRLAKGTKVQKLTARPFRDQLDTARPHDDRVTGGGAGRRHGGRRLATPSAGPQRDIVGACSRAPGAPAHLSLVAGRACECALLCPRRLVVHACRHILLTGPRPLPLVCPCAGRPWACKRRQFASSPHAEADSAFHVVAGRVAAAEAGPGVQAPVDVRGSLPGANAGPLGREMLEYARPPPVLLQSDDTRKSSAWPSQDASAGWHTIRRSLQNSSGVERSQAYDSWIQMLDSDSPSSSIMSGGRKFRKHPPRREFRRPS